MGPSVRTSPPAPAMVALVGVLVAILAAPVIDTPAAGAARAADAAASVDHRPSVAGEAATTRVRVVDHNIEKRPVALKRALKAARHSAAEIITLQEVCWWQVGGVRSRHPDWTISWKPERNNDSCRRLTHPEGTLGIRRKVGNLAIWTGGSDGVVSTRTYRPQRVDGDRAGLACVSWVDGASYHACSVHLISPTASEDVKVRTAQAKDLRRITRPWIADDELVVLGGDFNAAPGRRTMRFLYDTGGAGQFREATSLRRGGPGCRCAQFTFDGQRVKIDYIFFSANRTVAQARRKLRVIRTVSDHHLLVGWADVDASKR